MARAIPAFRLGGYVRVDSTFNGGIHDQPAWSGDAGQGNRYFRRYAQVVLKYDLVLEFDIKGLFDNIDHELLLRAVRRHVTCKWALLYIERWLTAPMEQADGLKVERIRGDSSRGRCQPDSGKPVPALRV